MNKLIKINESQLKKVINLTLNEDVDNNIITSMGNIFIQSILQGGVLYDMDAPGIYENKPTLISKVNEYVIYLIGDTDSKPSINGSYNSGNYNNPPEDNTEIIWDPNVFIPEYVYGIFKNGDANNGEDIGEEYTEILNNYILEKLPKIPINNQNYKIIVNQEDFESPEETDIDKYDAYRDDRLFN